MFGIVLWRSEQTGTAVVWCEDHGDLAFLRDKSAHNDVDLTGLQPGDLLQFDVVDHGNMRVVRDPRLVREDHYPTLARRLKDAGSFSAIGGQKPEAPSVNATGCTKIVPFEPGDNAHTSAQRNRRRG